MPIVACFPSDSGVQSISKTKKQVTAWRALKGLKYNRDIQDGRSKGKKRYVCTNATTDLASKQRSRPLHSVCDPA